MSDVLQFPSRKANMEEACRSLRSSIYRARDAAHQRACEFRSLDAGQIAHIASQIAAPWAFNRRASVGQLEQALDILDHLIRGADALERLEASHGA